MDPRLEEMLSRQQAARFADLAGTEAEATIRISDRLLNEAIAAFLPSGGAVRSVTVGSHAGDRLRVTLTLAKPAFLPPIPLTLVIERQPELRADPVLVVRLAGGVGSLMRFAGPALGLSGKLPPGIRLDGKRLFVDVRTALEERGRADVLEYLQQLRVTTEEGRLLVHTAVRVP